MASAQDIEIVSSFVEGAPPGELASVVADIESLAQDRPQLVAALAPAFATYNEEQFATVTLPGGGGGGGESSTQPAIVCADSRVDAADAGRYYDPTSGTSFAFDHRTQKASDVRPHSPPGGDGGDSGALAALAAATLQALAAYVPDHYARPAFGVYPVDGATRLAVVIVSNKYSPQNFWNGRWRSRYVFDPASGALEGSIRVDVHYYEDGNVRLLTDKPQAATLAGGGGGSAAATGPALAREIAALEKAYQEELNKKFLTLSEGAFKSLRRQLPVTRQKIEWDKVASYRLGQDIGGGGRR